MSFFTLRPAPALVPYVERYFVADICIPEGEMRPLLIAPTSTSQLAVNCATANLKPDAAGMLNDHFVTCVVGPFTRRHDYSLHGYVRSVAVYFTPTGLHALLGIDMTNLTDQAVDFARFRPDDANVLIDLAHSAETNEEKVQQLERYLLSRIPFAAPVDPAIIHTVETIRQQLGPVTMTALLDQVSMTQRTLERNFRRVTGMTPKQFARITRFLTVRNAVADGTYKGWHDVLHRGGYYDQAHFIREFSLFTGQTPSVYFARDLGLDNFLCRP